MQQDVIDIIARLISRNHAMTLKFPNNSLPAPPLASVVSFPRLDIVIEGEVQDKSLPEAQGILKKYNALYIPAGKWNLISWTRPATLLSILFSKNKLGFSIQHWDGDKLIYVDKQNVARLGPRVGSFLLQAMNEIVSNLDDQQTARLVLAGLLSHCSDQLINQAQKLTPSRALFEVIQEYIDDNASFQLTRDDVAKRFHISPNYLSHLFRKTGSIGFNEYLNHVRLERAKLLLKGYDMKVKEIASSCGFIDSNYFCRIFRKSTARSPTEYRSQWRSQCDNKESNDLSTR